MSARPPPYAVLGDPGSIHQHPPYRRSVPRYDSNYNRDSGGGSCLRCICGCCCCLFLLVIVITCFVLYFFLTLEPKMPLYKVESLDVKTFDIQADSSLNTLLQLSIEAANPNKHIGISYGKGGSVIVSYNDSILCSGLLPNFYQGYENTTIMNIELKGKTKFSAALQKEIFESRSKATIPLLVTIKAPIEVFVLKFSSGHLVVGVICSLVVDNLSPDKKIEIISSNYSFHGSL